MYKCNICKLLLKTMRKYELHLYYHRNACSVNFKCVRVNCKYVSKNYGMFKQHIYRKHTIIKENSNLKDMNTYKCSLDDFEFKNKKVFLNHIYTHIKTGLSTKCPFENCHSNVVFEKVVNFRNHVMRNHSNEKNQTCTVPQELANDCADNSSDVSFPISIEQDNCVEKNYSELLSSMYLTLEAKFFVTNEALQFLINGFSDINEFNREYVLKNLDLQVDMSQIRSKFNDDLFSAAHNKSNGYLRSKFIRHNFYKKQFNYVEPQKIYLDQNSFFFYIPIQGTLKVLLENERFHKLYNSSYHNQSGDICNITDSLQYKRNTLFSENKSAIQLILFQDSFEICNPIGAFRNKKKIIGVYMTIGNIPPWHRSRVENIQLVALMFEKDVKKCGFAKAFEVIINDIKKLEIEGIHINNTCYRGTLFAMVGDNLGSHQIGGFIENFNINNYFCRYCYIHESNKNGILKNYNLRTKLSYEDDVNLAIATEGLYNGVRGNSKLNDLKYYHVCDPGLAPCIAHDLFEGVIQTDLMLCLNKLIETKIFSFDYLNEKIRNIKFLCHEKLHFPIIKKSPKLPGTAIQNMWLIIVLPFLIADKFELICKETLKLILLLRRITTMLLSFKISLSQIAILRTLIFEYIEYRQILFPDIPLKPKHHYMSHFPFLIKHFGPLRHLWTLRFESKHQYFKKVVKHTSNYRNVLYSLTEKHQLLQALNLSQNSVFTNELFLNKEIQTNLDNVPISLKQKIVKIFGENLYMSTDIDYRSISYKKNMVVCYEKTEFGTYLLCEIISIIIDQNFDKVGFLGNKIEIFYDEDNGLYHNCDAEVTVSQLKSINILISVDSLLSPEPLLQYEDEQILYYFKSAPYETY